MSADHHEALSKWLTAYLGNYTLPANYAGALYGQSHREVAKYVGPVIAEDLLNSPVMRDLLAEAWFDGYSKGNLDGYFGTRDERAKSPYIDRDPYREEQP